MPDEEAPPKDGRAVTVSCHDKAQHPQRVEVLRGGRISGELDSTRAVEK